MSDRPDTIVVYRDSSMYWRWTRRAPNGEVVGSSTEGYTRKGACLSNIADTQGGEYVIDDSSTD